MNKEIEPIATREQRLMEAAEWLLRLRDPAVTSDEIAAWRAWCSASPENDRAFAEILSLWETARAAPRNSASAQAMAADDYQGNVSIAAWQKDSPTGISAGHDADASAYESSAAAVQTIRAAGIIRRSRPVIGGGVLAAAAAAVVTLHFLEVFRAPASPQLAVATEIGMRRDVTLPDHSVVILAGASRLNARFSATQRDVTLVAGEAYFRIAKDKHRPFVVHALDAKVTAVGTAFNVRAENHTVRVAVTEGVVEVARPVAAAAHRTEEKLHLTAGRELTWQAGRAAPVVVLIDQTRAASWLSGTLEFSNEPLSSVIAAVNRYAPRPLRFEPAFIGEYRFTGTVDVQHIDEWLAGLPNIFPVVVQRDDGAHIIAPRPATTD